MIQLVNTEPSQAYRGQAAIMTVAVENLEQFNELVVGMFAKNTLSNKTGKITFIDKTNRKLEITPISPNDTFSSNDYGILNISGKDELIQFTYEPYFLRMLFDDISSVPVLDPTDPAQWDEFFEFAEESFTVAYVIGNEVWLGGGGSNQILIGGIFDSNTSIINFIDEGGIFSNVSGDGQFKFADLLEVVSLPNVINLDNETFMGCGSLKHISLPRLTTLSGKSNFRNLSSLTTVFLPSLTTISSNGTFESNSTPIQEIYLPLLETIKNANKTFNGCDSLTKLYMPKCSTLNGLDMTDISGQNIELTIPLSLMESSALPTNPNIQYLLENNNIKLTTV